MRTIIKKIIYISFFIFLSLYAAYFLEAVLEVVGWYKHKLLLGLTGISLIFISFLYSIIKRCPGVKNKLFYLRLHIIVAILGSIIIFTHANFKHNFIFPILTYCLLFVVYSSGFVGCFLVREVKKEMEEQSHKGVPLHSLIVMDRAVSLWRTVHIPLVAYWFVFLVIHVVSTLYYYGLRY